MAFGLEAANRAKSVLGEAMRTILPTVHQLDANMESYAQGMNGHLCTISEFAVATSIILGLFLYFRLSLDFLRRFHLEHVLHHFLERQRDSASSS
jgi:hypothetical protein